MDQLVKTDWRFDNRKGAKRREQIDERQPENRWKLVFEKVLQ